MMCTNDFSFWQRPHFQTLSDDQLERILTGAMETLERVGGEFHDPECVRLLADAGAHVTGKTRVRIPAHLVEAALGSVPKRVVVCDRNGRRKMFLQDRNTYFGCGSDTTSTLDPITAERRPALKSDVARAAQVSDALSDIDFCMSFGLASDVNRLTSDCHHFEAMVQNTTKPLVITAWDLEGLERIYDMMVAVKGDPQTLLAQPFVTVFLMAISPLVFPRESLQKLLFCAQHRIPVIWTSGCPTTATTAPVDPAGAMAVGVAEFLAGLVLAQLKNPTCPVIMGAAFGSLDMSTGVRPYGAPEQDFGHICAGEMARYLQIPSWGVGGTTDANVLDEQAVAEAHQKLFLSALAGSNLIHDVGYMESGLCSSLELLTICNEFISRTRRFLRGFVVSEETLALDVIEEIGPGGDYLTHDQTLARFREEIWMPELIDRQDYNSWKASGSTTLKERANAKVRAIIDTHKPQPLPADTLKFIRQSVAAYDLQRRGV